jgi:hypothetical protein
MSVTELPAWLIVSNLAVFAVMFVVLWLIHR